MIGLFDKASLHSEPSRDAVAILSHDPIADHFKQQQYRDRVDQKHRHRPGKSPPQKVIDAEGARVDPPLARDDLRRPRALFVIYPEPRQFAFVERLIRLDDEPATTIHPPHDFGGPRADAAIAVEEHIIAPRFDPHILAPFRTAMAEPSATKAEAGFAPRHSTNRSPYTRFTSHSKAAPLVRQTLQRGCSTRYSTHPPSRCAA